MRSPALVLVALLCASIPGPAAAAGWSKLIDSTCNVPDTQEGCTAIHAVCTYDVVVLACYPTQVCSHEPTRQLCSDGCDEVCQQLMCYPEPEATTCTLLNEVQDLPDPCEERPDLTFCHPGILLCTLSPVVLCQNLGPAYCPDAAPSPCQEAVMEVTHPRDPCELEILTDCDEPCKPHPLLGDMCHPVCRILEPGAILQPTQTVPECVP